MRISKRLRVIGDLVADNSFILDVGCDHALLDIYVVLSKKNVKAIASDINEKPLVFAKENVSKYDLEDKITLVKADGLDSYKKGVNTIVLSGLGSTTIVNILNAKKEVLDNIDNLIISSNNDYYFLRKEICNLGFMIEKELLVIDKKKYYPIIKFVKGKKKYNKYELKYGPILLEEKSKDFLKYIDINKKKLIQIYDSLGSKYFIKKLFIKKEVKFLSKM